MNLHRAALLAWVVSSGVFGQTYSAKTIAGGGDLFPSNVPATSIGIGGASAMATDNAGNIYYSSGGYSVVVRWNVNTGNLAVVAGNGTTGFSGDNGPATSAQLGNNIYSIAVDSSGTVYISDTSNQRIRKVSNGVITTVAGTGIGGFSGDNGPAADAQVQGPSGVAVDSSGNLYIADIGNQRIRKISNGVITTVAGNGAFGFGGDNGPATDAQLEQPAYVAAGSSGEFYIPDYVSHRIRKVSNGVITTIAGTGAKGYSGDNGPAANAQLNGPGSIVVDSSGNLYIADIGNQRIRKISNGVITTVAGNGFSGGPLGDNGPATATAVSGSIVVDPSGKLYIGDYAHYRIRKVSNGVITTVAGNGSDVHQGYSGDSGPALSALLSLPQGVAVDPFGTNIYIADTNNSSIRKISNGVISTVPYTIAPGCNDGQKSPIVPLSPPRGLAVDTAGNIYIAEYYCVREISQGVLVPFAGTGTSATTGDNGPAIQARLGLANGLVVDSSGTLYIVTGSGTVRKVSNGVITAVAATGGTGIDRDALGNLYVSNGNRILKISSGVITTVAGSNTTPGFGGDNGPATAAKLNANGGVAVDSFGNLYIADTKNNRIRKVSNGIITTIAGNDSVGYGADGPATGTALNQPQGIALDDMGNIYVADTGNSRIVKLSLNCDYTLSLGGQAFTASGGTGTITITTDPVCPWSVGPLPAGVVLTSAGLGIGNGSVTFQVAPNGGGNVSSSFTIAGKTFAIEQSAALIGGLAPAGSLGQVASKGTWDFSLIGINLGASAATARFTFADNTGNPLSLPLTFPQSPVAAGPLLAATLDRTLSPNVQIVMQSTGPDDAATLIGSGRLLSNGNVSGFGIFSNPKLKWNAVVPLETRNASKYVLAFDNTGPLTTGVAIANLAAQATNVPVVIRDDSGVQIGNPTIALSALGHTSFMLNDPNLGFPVTNNQRGTIEFDTPPGGQISVLGLRANGPALTTLPVLANVGTGGGSITHVAYNNGWTSIFYVVNTGTAPAQFTLSFFDESGIALPVPLLLPKSGATLTTAAFTQTVEPGAMLAVETQAQDAQTLVIGSAQLTTTGNIGGFEIFRWTTFGQEASVPLESRTPNSFVLVFDDTNGLTTGVALANFLDSPVTIPVSLRDDTGTPLPATPINLPPHGHISFMLPDPGRYPSAANKRGMVEFLVPAGARISAVGLRAKSDGTLTTIPVLTR